MKKDSDGNNVRKHSAPGSFPRWRLALYALIPSLILFGGIELVLRVVGFEFHGIPTHLQFGPNLSNDIKRNAVVPDDNLFWRLRVGPDNKNVLAPSRLVHPAFSQPEPSVTDSTPALRIVAMGDSCTFFGSPPYPMLMEKELLSRGLEAEVFNASLPGYTSYQGRRWFGLEITGYRPDWITIYYGWNDHWLALQAPDHELSKGGAVHGSAVRRIIEKSRIVQAALWLQLRLNIKPPGKRPPRVSLENYRDNLNTLCLEAGSEGVNVMMITAPSDLDENNLKRLHDLEYISDPSGLRGLHERYNQVVREVSESCGAHLIDFSRESKASGRVISDDGIHLTPIGIAWLASRLADTVAAESEGGKTKFLEDSHSLHNSQR